MVATCKAIFLICHHLDDADMVIQISSAMAKYGFSSWLSSRDISKGEEFNHAIHNAMVQSANMLFFISKKSLKSDYCIKELLYMMIFSQLIFTKFLI